jgi:hypothetical protein
MARLFHNIPPKELFSSPTECPVLDMPPVLASLII